MKVNFDKLITLIDTATKRQTVEVTISPVEARRLLERNTNNRKISSQHIKRLTQDMQDGAWADNGMPLGFDNMGRLADGQHRLKSLILAQRTESFLVNVGLEPEAKDTIDLGKSRTTGDILTLRGEPHGMVLASILRNVFVYSQHQRFNEGGSRIANEARSSSFPALEAFLLSHPGLRDSAGYIANQRRWKNLLSNGLLGSLHYLFSHANGRERADFFFERLATGVGLEEGSPILALRERLLDNATKTGAKLPQRNKLALTIKAFNAYIDGRTLKWIRWGSRTGSNRREKFPTINNLDIEALQLGDGLVRA